MKKSLHLTIGLLVLLLAGCISEELQNAASKAATTIKASKAKVAKGIAVDTDKENYKSLNIEFSDFENVADNFDNDKVSSTAALVFFRNLKAKDYSGYEKIQITLARQNTTSEIIYDIKKLQKVEGQMSIIQSLIEAINSKSFESYEILIDTTAYDREVQLSIYNEFMKVDSLSGKISKNVFTGFKFRETQTKKIPQTVIWCELIHASDVTELTFHIDSSTNKIMRVGINTN